MSIMGIAYTLIAGVLLRLYRIEWRRFYSLLFDTVSLSGAILDTGRSTRAATMNPTRSLPGCQREADVVRRFAFRRLPTLLAALSSIAMAVSIQHTLPFFAVDISSEKTEKRYVAEAR